MANILVIDDNPVNLRLAEAVLRFSGYSVFQAEDAEQAQLLLRQMVPDLILMDIALPGMDGLALTKMLKSDKAFRNVPIIALTAFAMKGDEDIARSAGCDGYITKPIDTRALPGLIEQALAQAAERLKHQAYGEMIDHCSTTGAPH